MSASTRVPARLEVLLEESLPGILSCMAANQSASGAERRIEATTAKIARASKNATSASRRATLQRASIRQKGVVTIPLDIRRQLELEEGDEVIFTLDEGRIILTPAAIVPRDQAWFWTREWQTREAEADAELAAGKVDDYDTDEEFLASLDGS